MSDVKSIENIDTSQPNFDELEVGVIFNEEDHTYTSEESGEKYLNFSLFLELYTEDKVPNLPQTREAAEHGKTIHKQQQDYLFSENSDLFDEVSFVEKKLKEDFFVKSYSEFWKEEIIWSHDLKIAGTVDLAIQTENDFIIADYKTGSQVDNEKWIFQLAYYSLMLWKQPTKYVVFHLPKFDENNYLNKPSDFFKVIEYSREDIERAQEYIKQFLADRKTRNEKALESLSQEWIEKLELVEARKKHIEAMEAWIDFTMNDYLDYAKDFPKSITFNRLKITKVEAKEESIRLTLQKKGAKSE